MSSKIFHYYIEKIFPFFEKNNYVIENFFFFLVKKQFFMTNFLSINLPKQVLKVFHYTHLRVAPLTNFESEIYGSWSIQRWI